MLCVADPGRTRATRAMSAAFGVEIWNPAPYSTEDGAEEIVGRGPWKRYGGE